MLNEQKPSLAHNFISDSQWEALVKSVPASMTLVDRDGRILFINRSGPERRLEEALGACVYDFLQPEEQQKAEKALKNVFEFGEVVEYEARIARRDGTQVWYEHRVAPVYDDADISAAIFIATDITKRKQAEMDLRAGEARFRRLAENAPEIIYRYRLAPEPGFEYVNPIVTEITGYSPEDHYANPNLGFELVHPDDRPLLQHATEGGHWGRPLTLRWIRKDGTVIWTEQRNLPVYDEDGALVALEGIARDVTERKMAEEQLRYQAQLLHSVSEAIIATDKQLRISAWNEAATTIYGWPEAEALGQVLDELLQTEFLHETQEQAAAKLMEAGLWQGELRQKTKSGEPLYIWASVSWIRNHEGAIVGGVTINRDITQRKHTENALQQSEARFKGVFENSPDIIALTDLAGKVLAINKVAPGYKKDDVIGSAFTDYLTPEQCVLFHETLEKAIDTETAQGYEVDICNPEGRCFYWYNRIAPVKDEGRIKQAVISCTDISARKHAELELQRYSNSLEGLVEERTRQLQKTQEQLVRREKLSVLGQMAGSVGHELRNPLATISNAVYYLKMILPDADESVMEYLDILSGETRNAEKIISDLLDFARIKSLTQEDVDLPAAVDMALERCTIPPSIVVRLELPDELPEVFFDRRQLEQILLNLFTNASEAMPKGGRLTVSGRQSALGSSFPAANTGYAQHPARPEPVEGPDEGPNRSFDRLRTNGADDKLRTNGADDKLRTNGADDKLRMNGADDRLRTNGADDRLRTNGADDRLRTNGAEVKSLPPADCVLLTVQDTGCGIAAENLEKLFEPLFSTKTKGIGLGLAIVKNLVEANGGRIEVESEEGRGTCFTFALPVCPEGR